MARAGDDEIRLFFIASHHLSDNAIRLSVKK